MEQTLHCTGCHDATPHEFDVELQLATCLVCAAQQTTADLRSTPPPALWLLVISAAAAGIAAFAPWVSVGDLTLSGWRLGGRYVAACAAVILVLSAIGLLRKAITRNVSFSSLLLGGMVIWTGATALARIHHRVAKRFPDADASSELGLVLVLAAGGGIVIASAILLLSRARRWSIRVR